jgi:hydroxyacylglutathione hydrolase
MDLNMLRIKQFRYAIDNLAYLIYGKIYAMAIDGGAAGQILAFIAENDLKLVYVANTHDHSDHTAGNDKLLNRSSAVLLSPQDRTDDEVIDLECMTIRVMLTPGHTDDSVCFYTGNALITGDTLFNGTIGNCFSGDLKGFYQSIKKLMAMPEDTIIYAGHDYVKASVIYALNLEPYNEDIHEFMARYDKSHVMSTLADEFRINPYLRFNESGIISTLKRRNLPILTDWDRWQSLMSLE